MGYNMSFFPRFISALMVIALITILPILLGGFGLILSLLLTAVIMAGGISEPSHQAQLARNNIPRGYSQGNNVHCRNYIKVNTMNVQNNHHDYDSSYEDRGVIGLIE